ncbi:unnamed protein product [Durusdinium trenchii]|uniref:Major facilitator superfamily (MFS) profile domain-containing protein n=1 Tax=Durusdinium trenchii TaxID=1381693 RepID=A0ABP0HQD5_9DINO
MSKCFKRTRTAVLLALAVLMSTLVAQPSTFAVARGIDHPPGPGVAGVQLFGGRPPRRGALSRHAATSAGSVPAKSLLPISLSVFVQMLGEGIAISTIPLHLLSFGATPLQVGLATSCFSVAQMVCCPALVSASSKFGRLRVLRTCLAGAAFASMLISLSSNIPGILLGRFLAGAFGASVPVAQAAVTDIVSEGAATALSRVAAAAQLGVVVGPAASAFLAALLGKAFGWPSSLCVRGVFGLTGIAALMVLGLSMVVDLERRLFAANCAVSGTVSTYCLFANRCLGYDQQKLSLVFSTGAATTVLTQLLLFPTLVWDLRGPQGTCFLGICCVALGLSGFSLCWLQPGHMLFYLLVRMGSGCADTSTATLVAENSKPKDRAQNLGFITSTRAATRIVTPIVSADLFEASLNSRAAPGALPYLLASSLAAGLSPVPLMLRGKS